MDGARFANAVAALGVAPADITWRAGVDVLSFGGTKNGIAVGEAVVFFDRELARDFDYRCKQGRPAGVEDAFPFRRRGGDVAGWRVAADARHANEMARRLAAGCKNIRREHFVSGPVECCVCPHPQTGGRKNCANAGWQFYTGVVTPEESRLMCSWDTTPEDVDAFVADLQKISS